MPDPNPNPNLNPDPDPNPNPSPSPNPSPNPDQALKDEERLAALSAQRGARPSGRPARGGGGAKARTPSQEEPEEPKADIIIDYGGKPDALVRG